MRSLRLFAIVLFAALVFGFPTSVAFAAGTVNVKGYTRKDGTYVAPHTRSAPNSTKADNWSTKGNVNPATGKVGTKSVEGVVTSPSTPSAVKPAASATGAQQGSQGATSETTSTAIKAPSSPASSLATWRAIHVMMTKPEVAIVLGEPNIKADRKWVYVGGGTVSFSSDGQVVGFMAPAQN